MADFEKYIKDGKVAVLISTGYGAGWYSWNSDCERLVFDKELVQAVLDRNEKRIIEIAKKIKPDGYFGGSDGLCVEWLESGTKFEIDEYDGAEGIRELGKMEFLCA